MANSNNFISTFNLHLTKLIPNKTWGKTRKIFFLLFILIPHYLHIVWNVGEKQQIQALRLSAVILHSALPTRCETPSLHEHHRWTTLVIWNPKWSWKIQQKMYEIWDENRRFHPQLLAKILPNHSLAWLWCKCCHRQHRKMPYLGVENVHVQSQIFPYNRREKSGTNMENIHMCLSRRCAIRLIHQAY